MILFFVANRTIITFFDPKVNSIIKFLLFINILSNCLTCRVKNAIIVVYLMKKGACAVWRQ